MYRVRNGGKAWRKRWPWSRMFPLRKVDERFCRECRLPYHNGPLPKEVKQFTSGNVSALIYPAGNWGHAAFCVKFGRWKSRADDPYLSPYLALEDIRDLAKVATQAHRYMDARSNKRRMPWHNKRSAHQTLAKC